MTDLPQGWREVALGEVAETQLGKMLNSKKQTGTAVMPYLRNINLRWGGFDLSDVKEMDIFANEAEQFTLKMGDLLICEGGEPGRCAVWKSDGVMAFQNAMHRVRPHAELSSWFLALQFEAKVRNGELEHLFSGVTIKHFSQQKLRAVDIALPPLAEQERIVEILEEQFSRLDSALASVKAVREKAQAFRRSLLHSAFSGELTGGTEGWREVALGELLEVLIDHRGKTPKKLGGDFTDSGVRVISAIHIKQGKVKFDERDRFVTEEMFLRWMPEKVLKGDVLLTSEAPLGSVAEVISDEPLVLSQRLFCLRADGKQLTNRFLALFLTSPEGQLGLRGRSSGTTVTGIRQSELVRMVTPVPPLSTQERIVSLLEEQFSRLDKALEVANQLEARIASERRSLLHSAFTGALTATWRQNND